jgi:cation:H+ antiporter
VIGAPLPPEEAQRSALQAVWTFPSILASAFVVAWGAEAAQFYVSQGLALALLAWIQVLPEFAVEAVIAWHRDVALMTANFTGALRLLTGLGWPMIWTVFAITHRRHHPKDRFPAIELDPEHSAELIGLVPALLYFAWIILKGSLDCVDAAVLLSIYAAYLIVLNRIPPRDHEEVSDLSVIPRAVIGMPGHARVVAIVGMFALGAALLYVTAHPFLDSMIGLSGLLGVSQFFFVQWVAPFLSEFPEFASTAYWARSRGKAGMALMNMASSNVNQWTVLAAMIPIVYSWSLGTPSSIPLAEHRMELILTLLQSLLGVVLLSNFNFKFHEAVGLFVLWLAQFLKPGWREEVAVVYAVWLALELISRFWRRDGLRAFAVFPTLWRMGSKGAAGAAATGPGVSGPAPSA